MCDNFNDNHNNYKGNNSRVDVTMNKIFIFGWYWYGNGYYLYLHENPEYQLKLLI